MQNALGFMPGEHDWMDKKAMPGQAPMPEKKPGPIMNALGAAFQIMAPDSYARGKQQYTNRQVGNALASKDYGGAADIAYKAGNLDTGYQVAQMGDQAAKAQRQQEAQGVLNLFQSVQPAQISEMAMTDPVGFERMTGMTADEYMQAGQRMVQAGLSPDQFHQYVIQKAQAELGIAPAGPVEGKAINNRLVNPVTGEVMGDYSDPAAPEYERVTTADGIYEYIPGQPDSMRKIGEAPVKTPLVNVNTGQQQQNPYANLPDGTAVDAPAGTKDLPAGQRYVVRGGQLTIENIPGGAEAAAEAEAAQKRLGRDASVQRAGRTVVREVGRGLELMPKIVGWGDGNTQTEGADTTGADEIAKANARAFMAAIPGSAEYQFMQNIESALSNVGLDRLQEMRENSPTGGALGQVPFQQQQRLEQVLGAFKITMPKPVMEENLKYMNNAYMDIMFGSKEERDALVQQGKLSPEKNDEIQSNYYDLSWNEFGRYEAPPEGFVEVQ